MRKRGGGRQPSRARCTHGRDGSVVEGVKGLDSGAGRITNLYRPKSLPPPWSSSSSPSPWALVVGSGGRTVEGEGGRPSAGGWVGLKMEDGEQLSVGGVEGG